MVKQFIDEDISLICDALGDVADDFANKTILVAGGGGFLGRYFEATFSRLNNERLKESPCKVILVDNLATVSLSAVPKVGEHIRFLEADVAVPLEIDEPLDFIVNAAGIPSPYYYRAYPLETIDASIRGTRSLLELSQAKGARFTFFSSSEIYGDPDSKHVPTQESYRGNVSCMGPRACYDEGKRVGETLCYIFHGKYGIATNTIRPFNVFGPGMAEADYRVLPNFASEIKGGRTLKIYGTGEQTRTYCYATDAINGFLRVIARGVPGEAYNIGNPDPEIGVLELVDRIRTALGKKVVYDIVEYPDSYPADEPMRRCPDIRKAKLQLKYEPTLGLDDGLRKFFGWTDEFYTGKP
jgi:UDP-glucuronate decarboxylase